MPVVRSHCSAQAWTSRSVAEARLSMKSARVALANLWRAKWALMPAQEVLVAEPGDELAQGGGALGVADAVEVEEGGRGVGDGVGVGGDGVGGGALVGVVAPALAGDAEVDPGVGEGGLSCPGGVERAGQGGFGEGLVAHVLGEGLVEPDVVPPGQGDEVAEPHVGHLVGDDHGAGLALGVGDGGAVDELVAEGDESGVLHGARVELGDEGLVVGVERVGLVELLVVAVVAGPGDVEDLVRVGVQVRGEGAAAVDAEGQSGVLGGDRVPGAGGDRDEVGGDERGGGDGPVPLSVVFGDAVAEDGPAFGGGDVDGEDGLEVGLVEGCEDALHVLHEQLGVEVGLAVGGVGEAVHALAGAGVVHRGVDAQFVGADGEPGEGVAVAVEEGGVQGLSVETDRAQGGGLDLDEGVSGRAGGEPDDGGGVEGLLAGGEVEGDRVPLHVEDLGSGLRFVARQYGHGPMLPYGGRRAQRGSPWADGRAAGREVAVRRVSAGPVFRGASARGGGPRRPAPVAAQAFRAWPFSASSAMRSWWRIASPR
ncbi:hypothetical protein SBADM41S_10795 [Streptomyces badius]